MTTNDVRLELICLNSRKAGTFIDIPRKQVKEVYEIISETLSQIGNEEIIHNNKFPTKLKF